MTEYELEGALEEQDKLFKDLFGSEDEINIKGEDEYKTIFTQAKELLGKEEESKKKERIKNLISQKIYVKDYNELDEKEKKLVNKQFELHTNLLSELKTVSTSWNSLPRAEQDLMSSRLIYEALPFRDNTGGTISSRRINKITLLRVYDTKNLQKINTLQKEKQGLTKEVMKLTNDRDSLKEFKDITELDLKILAKREERNSINDKLNNLSLRTYFIKAGDNPAISDYQSKLFTAYRITKLIAIARELINNSDYDDEIKKILNNQFNAMKNELPEDLAGELKEKINDDWESSNEFKFTNKARAAGVRVPKEYFKKEREGLLDSVIMGFEYVKSKNLFDYLREKSNEASESLFKDLGVQVGRLHKAGIFHGDLSIPSWNRLLYNILVSDNGRETYLTDFESSMNDFPRNPGTELSALKSKMTFKMLLSQEAGVMILALIFAMKNSLKINDEKIISLIKNFIKGLKDINDKEYSRLIKESINDRLNEELLNKCYPLNVQYDRFVKDCKGFEDIVKEIYQEF